MGLSGLGVIAMHSSNVLPEIITKEVSDWARVALQLAIIVGSIILYLVELSPIHYIENGRTYFLSITRPSSLMASLL